MYLSPDSPPRRRRQITLALLACGLLVGLSSGCGKHGKEAPSGGSSVPPSQVKLKRNVELAQAEERPLDYYVETVGFLEAEGQTDIAAGVTGLVDEVLFREGQFVTPDTVLVRVDQARYKAAAEIARANEKTAEQRLTMAREEERFVRSARQGSAEEEKVKKAMEVRVAEAEVSAAHAVRSLAEHNLARSQVRAPYAGQINQRKVTPGTYLEERTMIGTIADLSRLRLVGWIPEKAAPTVRELLRQQETIRAARLTAAWLSGPNFCEGVVLDYLDARGAFPVKYGLEFALQPFPRKTFRGRIFYLSTVANPETHMFECKAEVNVHDQEVELKPGYTARIRCLLHGNAHACVVPEESVRASDRGFIAFVPVQQPGRDGKPEWVAKARSLELGYRSPGWVEVLKGLSPGEWLVRRGAEALENDTPIRFADEQLARMASTTSGK